MCAILCPYGVHSLIPGYPELRFACTGLYAHTPPPSDVSSGGVNDPLPSDDYTALSESRILKRAKLEGSEGALEFGSFNLALLKSNLRAQPQSQKKFASLTEY